MTVVLASLFVYKKVKLAIALLLASFFIKNTKPYLYKTLLVIRFTVMHQNEVLLDIREKTHSLLG